MKHFKLDSTRFAPTLLDELSTIHYVLDNGS